MTSSSRIVAKNSLFSLLGQVSIKALSFCFSVFVVRRLGSEDYGQYSTALAYVLIFRSNFYCSLELSRPYIRG
jgi:O-antigen/teichoic acid export membrane protein